MPLLASYVSGINTRSYRLDDFDDYNNLISLAQHHGYPTPMLDWTESPYIAAYFALRDASPDQRRNMGLSCRVFAFDTEAFASIGSQAGALEVPHLCLYPVRAAARDSDRAAPQQSAFLLANVVEIEAFIAEAEQASGKRLLLKIDLPLAESCTALDELRFMGLTEASLFP